MASPIQWTWICTTPGYSEGQGSLVCCGSWGHRVWYDIATKQQIALQCHVSFCCTMKWINYMYTCFLPLGFPSYPPKSCADTTLYWRKWKAYRTHLTLLAMIKQFLLHVIILLIIFPSFVVILSCSFFICLQCWLVYILIDICAIGHYIHGRRSVYNSNHERRRNLENLLRVILLTFLYSLNDNNENKRSNKDTE